MKKIFVIIDGVSDKPCRNLEGNTPLESAQKPNLDNLTENGTLGFMYPLKKESIPDSDTAITSILGYKPFMESRGVLEAIGAGINFTRGDLILRTNFATIDNFENKKLIDRRAGRTLTKGQIKEISNSINKNQKLDHRFEYIPTQEHRGLLIIRGGFSDNISNTDPKYEFITKTDSKVLFSKPLDDEENSQLSADLVNNITKKIYDLLEFHPVNLERKKKGLLPANILLFRDAGNEKPDFRKIKRKWAAFAYTPLAKGISISCGMDLEKVEKPEIKGLDFYAQQEKFLKKIAQKAKKFTLKKLKSHECLFIHFMETDLPGHDNKPLEKTKMIEILDKEFFSCLKDLKEKDLEIIITSDHTTACSQKQHTSDPVPLLVYGRIDKRSKKKIIDETNSFTEEQAKTGALREIYGKEFMKKIMKI